MISGATSGAGFGGCIDYVTGKPDAQTLETRGVINERTAAAEMRAVANRSERVQKPVYHRYFRSPEGEKLTDKQWLELVDKSEKTLGLNGHQRIVVKHGNDHVHVVWNRVDPETGKAVKVSHDYAKIEQTCRAFEKEHGLQQVPGHHSWKMTPAQEPPQPRESVDAQRMEERTGKEPFARIVGERANDALDNAASWQDLNERLERAGLRLEPYRQGLVLTDGKTRVGLSKVSENRHTKAKLEQRFGKYGQQPEAKPETKQTKPEAQRSAPEKAKERPDLWAEYQQATARQRLSQQQQIDSLKAGYRQVADNGYQQLSERHRAERYLARKNRQRLFGRGIISKVVGHFEDKAIAKRQALERVEFKEQRKELVAELRRSIAEVKAPSFKDWLRSEAERGRDDARRRLDWMERRGDATPGRASKEYRQRKEIDALIGRMQGGVSPQQERPKAPKPKTADELLARLRGDPAPAPEPKPKTADELLGRLRGEKPQPMQQQGGGGLLGLLNMMANSGGGSTGGGGGDREERKDEDRPKPKPKPSQSGRKDKGIDWEPSL